MTETPLARRLAAGGAPPPDPLSAFKLARCWFIEGRKVEMGELATELGVNRATLFRWVGGRDELLAEVVWSVTAPTFHSAVGGARGSGSHRVAAVMGRFAQATISSASFLAFVQREPDRAMRILTTRTTSFQARLVALVEQLIQEEVDLGRLDPPLPVHDLAFLILRIGETFTYRNVIIGEEPDAIMVQKATAALLR